MNFTFNRVHPFGPTLQCDAETLRLAQRALAQMGQCEPAEKAVVFGARDPTYAGALATSTDLSPCI